MRGIQYVLLGLVIVIGIYFFTRLRNRVIDLVILSILAIAAGVFIIFPDLTLTIARFLGVGRGSDLVFYVSILAFWFVLLKLYSRQRRLEQQLTKILRNQSIESAEQQIKEEKQA